MISLEIIKDKINTYIYKLQELNDFDVEAEVENRLKSKREEVTAQVNKELEDSKNTCKNYIEILNSLLDLDEKTEQENEEINNEGENNNEY